MYKSVIAVALFVLAEFAVATPPACLLAAINKQPNPADLKTICCQKSSDVQKDISSLCGGASSTALSFFADTCNSQANCKVSSTSASSSGTASTSASSSATATGALTTGTSGPKTIVYTSTYYDTVCGCTKTGVISSSGIAGPTGFSSGMPAVPTNGTVSTPTAPAGTPISPTATGTKTGSSSAPTFTGAAGKLELGSFAVFAIAGLAFAL